MGQKITVTQAPSLDENTIIFNLDRSLTGMEILTYNDLTEVKEPRNIAESCAKAMLEAPADSVSIYSNMVTIKLKNNTPEIITGLENKLENLIIYYEDNKINL